MSFPSSSYSPSILFHGYTTYVGLYQTLKVFTTGPPVLLIELLFLNTSMYEVARRKLRGSGTLFAVSCRAPSPERD